MRIIAVTLLGLGVSYPVLPQQTIIVAQVASEWRSLAKISAAEAESTAEAAHGGTASSVTLANRNDGLVYEVVIGETKVIVDAGNGFVLYSENITLEDADEESFRPRSSISLPESDQPQQ